MADPYRLRWDGTEDFVKLLGLAPQKLRDRAVKSAIGKGGRLVAATAKPLIRRRTGLLQKAMGCVVSTRGWRVTAKVGPRRGFGGAVLEDDRGRLSVMSKSGKERRIRKARAPMQINPTRYAHLLEKGHKGKHPAPAYPFLSTALEICRGQIASLLSDELRRAIDRGAGIT